MCRKRGAFKRLNRQGTKDQRAKTRKASVDACFFIFYGTELNCQGEKRSEKFRPCFETL